MLHSKRTHTHIRKMWGIIIIDEVTMGRKANFSSEYLQYAYLPWPHNERDKSSQVRDRNPISRQHKPGVPLFPQVLAQGERGQDGSQNFVPLFHREPLSFNFTKHSICLEEMIPKREGKSEKLIIKKAHKQIRTVNQWLLYYSSLANKSIR